MNASTPQDSAYDAVVSSLEPGWLVGGGRYTLVRLLSRGGLGVVWLAEDEQLKEHVALKFLPPEIGLDAVALEDLKRETTRARKLTHPNIVRIHDLFKSESEAFISMEFVEGANLHDLRHDQPNGVFAWETLQPLVRQLCDALDYAHGEGVIHRDIKPANLLLDGKGRLKLADFGFAVAGDASGEAAKRLARSGTLTYMSPQQMDGEPAAVTDDIYSLGATLYELLSGEPPFSSGDIPHQIRFRLPPPLVDRLAESAIPNAVPPAVSALILACLAKAPAHRPQNAKAVAEWLDVPAATESPGSISSKSEPVNVPLADAGALPASPASTPATTPEPESEQMRAAPRRSLGVIAAVVLMVAAASILGWAWLKRAANDAAETDSESVEELATVVEAKPPLPAVPVTVPGQPSAHGFPVKAHSQGISGLAIFSDGQRLVSASMDDSIQVRDSRSGTLIWSRNAEQGGVQFISLSPDNHLLATAGSDATVKLWLADNGAFQQSLSSFAAAVSRVTFSPSNKYLATSDKEGNIALWAYEAGQLVKGWRGHLGNVHALSFSSEGQWLVSGGEDNSIRLWTVPDGRAGPVLSGHQGKILGISFSPDGKWMASTSYDKSLRIWNTRTWTTTQTIQYKSTVNRMRPVAFSPNSRFIAAGKPGALVTVIDVSVGKGRDLGGRLGDEGEITALAFLPDGSAIVGGDGKGKLRHWQFAPK